MKTSKHIAYASIFIALLLITQYFTAFFANQFLTGLLVNLILTVSVLKTGLKTSLFIAAISPLSAFILGIGPKLPPLIPFIAISNGIFVSLIYAGLYLSAKFSNDGIKKTFSTALVALIAACIKSLSLLISVYFMLPLIINLSPSQLKTVVSAFSFIAAAAAFAGGLIGLSLADLPPFKRDCD